MNVTTGRKPVRVLIVDDSAVIRTLIRRELSKDPGIEVVGSAPDAYVARDKVVELSPDVITLDVNMPKMDGITFLRHLMRHRPVPVIVLSSLTADGTRTAVEALGAGAVDVLCKPESGTADFGPVLIEKVKHAARAKLAAPSHVTPPSAVAPANPVARAASSGRVIAIGASTGGVAALTTVLTAFPANCPGTVIVQHMPAGFTASFASRLNQSCANEVLEARDGDEVRQGRILIAPGGYHMTVRRAGARYTVHLNTDAPVCHQRPSVDVLFESIAKCAPRSCAAALLTGMGADGASGLLALRQGGARTLAQDEASCTVFGMPAAAIAKGAAERVVGLDQVTRVLLDWCVEVPQKGAA